MLSRKAFLMSMLFFRPRPQGFLTVWVCAFLLACILWIPSAGQAAEPVSLNFSNADIEVVVGAIGKITGRNFLIDPRVKGKLNIVTNTPVAPDLTYPILLSALRMQGYTAIETDGLTKIVPESDAKLHAMPVRRGNVPGGRGERLVTQVFALRHEPANQMLQVVRPLVAPNNTVTAFPSNNTLVVTDYAENIERIAQIIASIDIPQGDVVVLELQHAAAMDLASTLERLLNEGIPGAQMAMDPTQRVRIMAEPRTNSLLVKADNPSRISAVRQLVASLDREGASGNLHVVYLKNAQAEQVAKTLTASLSSGAGRAQGNPQSIDPTQATGGAAALIQADSMNNALIINAPEAIYRSLRHVIDQLDRRRAQVYVEALIAEISTDRASEIGIQWQGGNIPDGQGGTSVFGGTNFGNRSQGTNIIGLATNPTNVAGGFNLMIGRGTVTLPGLGPILNLSFLARFLENDSKANILSTPNLVTLDNEEAKIVVGRNLPFVTGQYTNTGSATTPSNPFQTIERKDVGLTLRIKPQISEGGTVKLEIFQEVSSLATNVAVAGIEPGSGPVTQKRSIESTVLVDDGSIIALGGLVEDSYSDSREKVPLLGDIPLAGQLFRYDSRKRSKTNLIVFLRPVILRDTESYEGITQSRYEYVIGQQRGLAKPGDLMRGENMPAELPAFGETAPAVPVTRAPVEEATIVHFDE
jgi:general secretion pathway protein D